MTEPVSAAARRNRELNARKKRGAVMLKPVTLERCQILNLVSRGFLPKSDAENPQSITLAVIAAAFSEPPPAVAVSTGIVRPGEEPPAVQLAPEPVPPPPSLGGRIQIPPNWRPDRYPMYICDGVIVNNEEEERQARLKLQTQGPAPKPAPVVSDWDRVGIGLEAQAKEAKERLEEKALDAATFLTRK